MATPEPVSAAAPTRRELRARRERTRVSIVGVLGELLLTAGVLVFLFLGWQLWLNELIMGEQHRRAAVELAQEWDEDGIDIGGLTGDVDFGDPSVPPVAADTEPFAIMYVPRWGDYERTISEGVSLARVLNPQGIGRYPETQLPGEIGNFALAAHRTTFGKPFAQIGELRVGDRIYIRTPDGYITYVFRNMEYVWPTGVGVLNPVPQRPDTVEATDRILTLTSCNPLYSAAERVVAYAVYESWRPASAGPPVEIAHLVKSEA